MGQLESTAARGWTIRFHTIVVFLSCEFGLAEVEIESKQVYFSIMDVRISISLVKALVLPGDPEL